jgi:hypothetical protein
MIEQVTKNSRGRALSVRAGDPDHAKLARGIAKCSARGNRRSFAAFANDDDRQISA